jgi:hypothetical protein
MKKLLEIIIAIYRKICSVIRDTRGEADILSNSANIDRTDGYTLTKTAKGESV